MYNDNKITHHKKKIFNCPPGEIWKIRYQIWQPVSGETEMFTVEVLGSNLEEIMQDLHNTLGQQGISKYQIFTYENRGGIQNISAGYWNKLETWLNQKHVDRLK